MRAEHEKRLAHELAKFEQQERDRMHQSIERRFRTEEADEIRKRMEKEVSAISRAFACV